jgi:hypothetical protein
MTHFSISLTIGEGGVRTETKSVSTRRCRDIPTSSLSISRLILLLNASTASARFFIFNDFRSWQYTSTTICQGEMMNAFSGIVEGIGVGLRRPLSLWKIWGRFPQFLPRMYGNVQNPRQQTEFKKRDQSLCLQQLAGISRS